MGVYKRGSTWWIDVTVNGKRHRVSADTMDRQDAIIKEAQLKKQLMNGFIPVPVEAPSCEVCTLQAAFDRMLESHWKGTPSEKTVTSHMNQITKIIPPETPIASVDEKLIFNLIKVLKDGGNSPASINRKLSTLSTTLEHACYRWKVLPVVPFIPRGKESRGRMMVISKEQEAEILRIANTLSRFFAGLLAILFETGMRLSEALGLQWKDIDLEKRMIHIWENKTDNPRSIPMTDRLYAVLMIARQYDSALEGGSVPVGNIVQELTINRVQYLWSQVRRLMRIEDPEFTIHAIRHTVASRLVQNGVDLYVVAKWLGHTSIKTTERYAHLSPENLKKAAQVLNTFSTFVAHVTSGTRREGSHSL
jgi:integrase